MERNVLESSTMHHSRIATIRALAIVVAVLRAPFGACVTTDELHLSLKKAGVVPDVIATVPSRAAEVAYPGGATAQLGNTLTQGQAAKIPNINFGGEKGRWYTVIFLDPDAPSRGDPKMRHWLHWLVVNVPADSTTTLTEYAGPTPPRGTGKHRYVFLVYEQKKVLSRRALKGFGKERAKFDLDEFVQAANLTQLVAANFFYTENK